MRPGISTTALLFASATPTWGFCGSFTKFDRRAAAEEVPISEFGYTGLQGPLNWASLDPTLNQACSAGTQQSPINMLEGQFTLAAGNSVNLQIPDVPQGATFENLGTTVEVVMEGVGGSITVQGTTLNLAQFHFHHPSEHLDDGVSMPLEMHMVFQSESGETAVIGTYIDLDPASTAGASAGSPAVKRHRRQQNPKRQETAGVRSAMLDTVFASVGEIAEPGTKTTTGPLVMSDVVSALSSADFQTYSGSLTTPPCSEGVSWMVATQHLLISSQSYEAVRDVVGFNSRFPQNTLGSSNLIQVASDAGSSSPSSSPSGELLLVPGATAGNKGATIVDTS